MIVRLVYSLDLESLGEMNFRYTAKSEDDSISADRLILAAEEFLRNPQVPWAIWVLEDNGNPVGYAVTELVSGTQGTEMNITQAYIGEGYRGNGIQALSISEFEKYAKEKGCVFLTSMTRRGTPDAYLRWMGRVGFTKRSVIVEKDLRGG
jgi:GNAT superfamily N-acetyltransferase